MNNRKPAQIQLQNLPIDGQTDDTYMMGIVSLTSTHTIAD